MNKAVSVEPTVEAASTPRPTATVGFERRSPAQVVHSVDTADKVVFLTIDDGLDPDPRLLRYLVENHIPATAFLTTNTVTDWQYWKDIDPAASVQNHTTAHPSLPKLGPAGQVREICAANQTIAENTGRGPWMLRPPYGDYDASTLAAAGDCGLDWVVHWSVSLPGKALEYQKAGGSLKAGDIILTHFRKGLVKALPRVIEDIRAQGFELGRLEDYLPPRGVERVDRARMHMVTATESRAYPAG